MGKHDFGKDDPIYYKCALQGLLQEANENNLNISVSGVGERTTIYFQDDIGESVGVSMENFVEKNKDKWNKRV